MPRIPEDVEEHRMGTVNSDDHIMVGKLGRCTGRISPGHVGEVSVEVRGGVESFLAYGTDNQEVVERNDRVVIVEYFPPRTVYVSKA
jgi:hypothetical protein